MIIKHHKRGRSFKGVVRYLGHDKDRAETSDRLAWTHTLNLTNDHVPSAVNEMVWTARAADMLKRAAGISTAGSKLERPVKHFSLSWHVSETPTQEEMIEVTKRYLKHMGMEDRQAILFSHNDTDHRHVHVVLNVVSPEDGRALKSNFEYRRTQSFALQYEREQGKVFCEERLKSAAERAESMTRPAHERFKSAEVEFERTEAARRVKFPEYFERNDYTLRKDKEWKALKGYQRDQREAFSESRKQAFKDARKEAYKEIRQEFRGQWNAYYAARRQGGDPSQLGATKAALLEAQRKALDTRANAMCDALREMRDKEYEGILERQKNERAELTKRQKQGLRTYTLMKDIYPAPKPKQRADDRVDSKPWRLAEDAPQPQPLSKSFDRSIRAVSDPQTRFDFDMPAVTRGGQRVPAQPEAQRAERDEKGDRGQPQEAAAGLSPNVEMTEARVERASKAQEMTDRAATKSQNEATSAYRKAWNHHRRSGGRGD